MSLGFTSASPNGFTRRVQYDARAGRLFKIERLQDASGAWFSEPVEIPFPTQIVFDLANVEVGYIKLASSGVDFQVAPVGAKMPEKPTDVGFDGKPLYKQGFRAMLFAPDLGVREWASTAACVRNSVDVLHTQYEAVKANYPGQLPVVEWAGTTAVHTGKGIQRSTNYAPTLRIVGWVDRPADLGGMPAAPVQAPAYPQAPAQAPAYAQVPVQAPAYAPSPVAAPVSAYSQAPALVTKVDGPWRRQNA